MKKMLFIMLLMVMVPVHAEFDEVLCSLTWPIKGVKIGSPTLEVKASELGFIMSSDRGYTLDVGGSIELSNGTWEINTLRKSDKYTKFDLTFDEYLEEGDIK